MTPKQEQSEPQATGGGQQPQQPAAKRMVVKFEAFPPNIQEWANGELAAYHKAYEKALAAGDGEKVLRIRESIAAVLRKMSVEE